MNQSIFLWIHHFAGHNGFLDGLGIFFAEWLPYILVVAFLVLVFMQTGLRHRLYLFAEGALAVILARGIVTTAIRFFYIHPRPFEALGFTPLIPESGSSFPSGHATWFFALALVVWFANRKWGWWFFALATINGIARIYVGVHWPFDILGGAAIGGASGIFVHWLLKKSRVQLGAREKMPLEKLS